MGLNMIEALHTAIDNGILSVVETPRSYLGTSSIGTECDRQLWYSYHQPIPVYDARVKRIFKTGHVLESLVYEWLRLGGVTIYDVDADGKQFGFTDGIVQGHIDGIAILNGEKYLLEIKTSNEFRYKAFVKDGFCSDEKYQAQIHIYMNKFKMQKCLCVVLNKNTQELYMEIVEYDEFIALSALERGKNVVAMEEIPERKYPNKSFFKCKFCSHYSICWSNK
jgi:hypothetical protein